MSAPSVTTNAEEELKAHLRAEVAQLQAEHDDAHLQRLLQQDIAACKKKDSELSTVTGKVKVAAGKVRALQEAVRKTADAKAKTEKMCQVLETARKSREALTAEMSSEMEARRDSFRTRMETHLNEIRAGVEEREAKIAAVEAENEEMERRLGEEKSKFEAFYNRFQDSMKDRSSTFEELIKSCQETTKELEDVQARLVLVCRERNSLESNTLALEEHVRLYEAQFDSFAKSTLRPEDVAAVAAMQQKQSSQQIEYLETAKREANQLRLRFEKATIEHRARLAALKSELQQAEKAKVAAEKRCRQAEEKLRLQQQRERASRAGGDGNGSVCGGNGVS